MSQKYEESSSLEARVADGLVVWACSGRHIGYAVRRWMRSIVGGVLVLLGMTGLMLMTNGGFLLLSGINGNSLTTFPSLRELLGNGLTSVFSLTIAAIGLGVGYPMLRGDRVAVLFLRRFGFQDATAVASYAAARTNGHKWRLVTLDNTELAPVGISSISSWLLRSATLERAVRRAWYRTFQLLTVLIILIISAELLASLGKPKEVFQIAQRKVIGALFDGRVPLDAIHATSTGVCSALVLVYAFMLLLASIVLLAKLASSLLGANIARAAITGAARTANDLQHLEVTDTMDIDSVADTLVEGTQKIFAPRFIVMRVASKAWRPTVERLAARAPLILIDVSEPTDSLLWEIEHLTRAGLQSRCVFTCHGDRIGVLTAHLTGSLRSDFREQQLSAFLAGHQVLAYTSDRRGAKRFARALRVALIDTHEAAKKGL